MSNFHRSAFIVALSLIVLCAPGSAAEPAEWKTVQDLAATFADSSVGKRTRNGAKPVYHTLQITGKSLRFKWQTTKAGRNPDFSLDLSKEVTSNNGGRSMQRVAAFGRTHDNVKDGKVFDGIGPGLYRLEIRGHSMEYKLVIEELVKEDAKK